MRITEKYNINKTQSEIEFVDIDLDNDLEVFIDPYIFTKLDGQFARKCNNLIIEFFYEIIRLIRVNDEVSARYMLNDLKEPAETHLGLSNNSICGKGVRGKKAQILYSRLYNSRAVETGDLKDLSDCELMIKGIGKDSISDMTTNIIREYLIEFTQIQCGIYGIPMVTQSANIWDPKTKSWVKKDYKMPSINGKKILLVPKSIVTDKLILSYDDFYNIEVLEYYRNLEINAGTSIVKVLKNGERTVSKKDLKKKYPKSKDIVYTLINENPEYLELYKERKKILPNLDVDNIIAKAHGRNENISNS